MNLWNEMMKEIYYEEMVMFRNKVRSFEEDKRYYTYGLCSNDGIIFYVGKGSGMRAYNHLNRILNMDNYCDELSDKDLIIKEIFEMGDAPIVFLIGEGLTEKEALELEQSEIARFGRNGIDDGGRLVNIMPGGYFEVDYEIKRHAGMKGGMRTKENKTGIFSPDYDRGAQTRKNFEMGLMDHIDFVSIGKIAGKACYDKRAGIHSASPEKRSEWARQAGLSLHKQGKAGGWASKEWRLENSEEISENARRAGKISWQKIKENSLEKHKEYSSKGGKKTGKMPWWTNGKINTRSYKCPGEDFYPGMTRNSKKRK